jgi:hypothetical protein
VVEMNKRGEIIDALDEAIKAVRLARLYIFNGYDAENRGVALFHGEMAGKLLAVDDILYRIRDVLNA